MAGEQVWYKNEIKLPKRNWKSVSLELKVARFQLQVYINGDLTGKQNGGMATLFFELQNETLNWLKQLFWNYIDYLRFHIKLPSERFLDLCDRYGLVVLYEWSFSVI